MDFRRWGRRALVGLAVLLVLLTLLPEWNTDRWWVRQWDYPRLQVAGLLALVVAALFWVKLGRGKGFWMLVAATIAALVWQVIHFLEYVPLYPKEVASADSCTAGQSISLINSNVLMTNRDYQAVLAMARQRKPDVLLLLETGPAWEAALAPLANDYPYRLVEALPDTYGMILLSRLPMQGRLLHRLQPHVPSAKVLLTLPGGEKIILHALHPEPPWPGDDSGERDAELVAAGREVRADGRAAIVLGDLNDVAWSRTSQLFKKVGGMGDPRVGRGFYPTFNAKYPLLRWPLDHLFVTPHFKVRSIDVLDSVGSDHFPIAFSLCLTRPASERLVPKEPPPGTERESGQEIEQGIEEQAEEENGG